METPKDIEQLKKYLNNFTEYKGIKITENQSEAIINLADSLEINDIGGMTLFYTLGIMPILEMFAKKIKTNEV